MIYDIILYNISFRMFARHLWAECDNNRIHHGNLSLSLSAVYTKFRCGNISRSDSVSPSVTSGVYKTCRKL